MKDQNKNKMTIAQKYNREINKYRATPKGYLKKGLNSKG